MHKQNSHLEILYNDNYIIVVNKPAGIIIQGDKTGDKPLTELVKDYLRQNTPKKQIYLGLPHRLDRPTSGVVIMAKKPSILKVLNKMFHDGKVKKTYWAVVNKKPPKPQDTLKHYLWKNQQQNKSYALDYPKPGSKEAKLTYKLLSNYNKKYWLLEILLHTGRHHQIRAQLFRIGCKIIGDVKYGYQSPNPDGSILLHARKLSLFHPKTNEKLTILAPPPKNEIWNYFYKKLKNTH